MPDEGGLLYIHKKRKDGSVVLGLKPPRKNDNDYRAFQKRVEKRRAKKKKTKR